ncbi:MAG: acyl-CoA dehydrogenase, partial [Candidatus Marinamargulisbacteria bacterium]
MLNLLYEYLYWPLSWHIGMSLFILAIVIWFNWPRFLVAIVMAMSLWAYGVEPMTLVGISLVLVVVTVPLIRAPLVGRLIMVLANKFKVFPKVSATEKAALDAGTVWMDKELFSGDPNIKKLMTQEIRSLSADEHAFLDGPVAQLCDMIDDWEIQKNQRIPDHVWEFIKDHRFLGMIIPKEYGGLGLSAIGHSVVIEKIASVSATVAITVMVPNSLGPAELLLHYGTQAQKDQYLAKLATGDEMPCFGLTEPTAGSDAGGLQSEGVIFKGDDGALNIRFQWNKRWITLSGISTVIGLAFLLKDPDQLLGGPVNYGITCALIPTHTPGVDVSRRHDPLGVPFINCPTTGTDVIMPLSCIIGEKEGMGKGWTMLMDCLSAGRGISLPSLSVGGAQAMILATSSFGAIRQQFGMSVGQFEGIHEPLARIIGKTTLLKAARDYTCGAIDQGEKPSVISAILKLHSTEMFRDIVNDSMDILGGAGITQGPRNVTASPYKAAPIGITVEGANILTRTLIIFGQGALRCHPFAYKEVMAAEANDARAFDSAFFGHIGHILRITCRAIILTLTMGCFAPYYGGFLSPYKRKLVWSSALFALVADVSMLYFGGALKAKQMITGRLGDMLSWMYFATATMAYYQKQTNKEP